MLKELGGEVSCESAYDPSSTHLLCMKPARNEKVLSSIAAGKWVLHSSYVEACNKENKFLNVSYSLYTFCFKQYSIQFL